MNVGDINFCKLYCIAIHIDLISYFPLISYYNDYAELSHIASFVVMSYSYTTKMSNYISHTIYTFSHPFFITRKTSAQIMLAV